ncbi:hypothetical protein KX816_03830 [Sphingosinicellaceae bacterium]|nr:hypothetical protein KX816_03830 [Sphingosinicellaceae bacterium]
MSVVATALIYSGRPNPSWPIAPKPAAEIAAALDRMPRLVGRNQDLGGLGYSGVAVEITDPSGYQRHWSLFQGVARSADHSFADADRRIEDMVVRTVPSATREQHQVLMALAQTR